MLNTDIVYAILTLTQENEMVDWYGQPAGDCLGYLIHGLRWAEAEPTLRPAFAWQVCTIL